MPSRKARRIAVCLLSPISFASFVSSASRSSEMRIVLIIMSFIFCNHFDYVKQKCNLFNYFFKIET